MTPSRSLAHALGGRGQGLAPQLPENDAASLPRSQGEQSPTYLHLWRRDASTKLMAVFRVMELSPRSPGYASDEGTMHTVPLVMANPLVVGLIAFALILGGAFAGWKLRMLLPAQHLTEETKSLVAVSTAIVATLSALVLGLLISNANASFIRLGGEVTVLSAQILRLDKILLRYGYDAHEAREVLRKYAKQKTSDMFPDNPADVRLGNPSTYELLQRLEDMLLALKPANPRDQWWMGQAMTLASKIGDTRWLIAQQVGQGTPKAFVTLLVLWLALLFASFGLFAPHNLTSAVILTLSALAVAGAVAMFLELEQGFGRMIHISPMPMRQAVAALEAQQSE